LDAVSLLLISLMVGVLFLGVLGIIDNRRQAREEEDASDER